MIQNIHSDIPSLVVKLVVSLIPGTKTLKFDHSRVFLGVSFFGTTFLALTFFLTVTVFFLVATLRFLGAAFFFVVFFAAPARAVVFFFVVVFLVVAVVFFLPEVAVFFGAAAGDATWAETEKARTGRASATTVL